MHLRRIEIADFRKIGRRSIDGLADGLNIVVGDNEAGKSTVLAALRAAFFERHRLSGSAAESMLPYGAAARPTVSVGFTLDGGAWQLTKSFCQRPEALLEGPGERHVGDAVEDRLATLFGFTPPGRGGSEPEKHHGVHGLLWVEQGLRPNLGVGSGGRDTLAAALEREVGQVTGGERGRALVQLAEERRERFWDKRDRPRGVLAEAQRLVSELERELADLQERRRAYEARIDRLAAVTDLLGRHARDDRLARAAASVVTARQVLAAVEQQGSVAETASQRRREAEQRAATAVERLAARAALVSRRETARAHVDKAVIEAEEAATVLRRHEVAAHDADGRLDALRQALDAADTHHQALGQALHRRELSAALDQQRETLAIAEQQDGRRREALAGAAAIGVDAAAVAALAALEKAADRAQAALAAASVQVQFEPDGARDIRVGDAAHPGAQPLTLSRDTVLELEGFGRLRLSPGGGTAELARRVEAADRSLREALARHGAADMAAARRLLQERLDHQAEAASLTAALAALAPKGVEALRQAVIEGRAKLERLPDNASPGVADVEDLARADRSRVALRTRTTEAERESRALLAAQAKAAADAAATIARRDAAVRQLQATGDELAAARGGSDDDLLAHRRADADRDLAAARAAEAEALRAFAAADVESARLTLERVQRAEGEIGRDLQALRGEQRDLQVELRAAGQDGIGERLATVTAEIEAARTRLSAAEREAAASRLLHETLLAAQREARERWLGPVRRRVEPYLRLIHPESEIRMDDRTLEIEGLVRGGVLEQFGALSMGAREQVAVVTRLALADVLRAAGHPATVILDDALVNTDETRLDRMHNVLTRAARELQILIFTCRERDFLGLGATHRM